MVVQQAQIIRGDVEIGVDETDEQGVVDDVVVDTLEDDTLRLSGLTSVLSGDLERSVSDVQLVDPSDESR